MEADIKNLEKIVSTSQKRLLATRQLQLVRSEYLQFYRKAFSEVKRKCEQSHPDFSKHNIAYKQGEYHPFSFEIVSQLNNFQIVKVKVEIGQFTLIISILNSKRNSPLTKQQEIQEGAFGKIYTFSFINRKIAVKSYKIGDIATDNFRLAMSRAIQEYSIARICDCLECGSATITCFGFDILVFNNRIEFAMEQCQKVELNKTRYFQLLENLGVLHRYKIMHMDIKPENIMFSWAHQKVVFIDFGLSRIISEDCGFKSLTRFIGTASFSSKQMLNLFNSQNSLGRVDLYYNDLVCLQHVAHFHRKQHQHTVLQNFYQFNILENCQKEKDTKNDSGQNLFLEQYLFILLKFQAYFNKKNVRNLLNLNDRVIITKYGKNLLKLIGQLMPSAFYEELVFTQLKELQSLGEYQQFLQEVKAKKEAMTQLVNIDEENNKNLYSLRLVQSSPQLNQVVDNFKTVNTILKFIENCHQMQQEININIILAVIFNCLRFDQKNLSVQMKRDVANTFLKLILADQPISSDSLASIKAVYRYLLDFCLSYPLTQWKNSYRFNILTQAFLMELNFQRELSKHANYSQYSLSQLLKICYQFTLVIGLDKLRIKMSKQCKANLIQIKINLLEIKKTIISHCQGSERRDYFAIAQIISTLIKIQTKEQQFQVSLYQLLDEIEDGQKAFPLLKMLFLVQHSYFERINDFSGIMRTLMKIRAKFEENPQLKSKIFFQKIFWDFTLFRTASSRREYFIFREDIRQTINCDQIYQTLKFYLRDIATYLGANQDLIKNVSLQLAKVIFEEDKVSLFKNQFYHLLETLGKNQSQLAKNVDTLQNIAELWIQYISFKFSQKVEEQIVINKRNALKNNLRQNRLPSTALRQFSCQFLAIVYFDMLSFGETMKEHVRRFQSIIKTNYWKSLQKYALQDEISHQATNYSIILYYYLVRAKALFDRNFEQFIQVNLKFLQILKGQLFAYFYHRQVDHLLRHKWVFCKVDKRSMGKLGYCKEKLQNLLIWGWKYQKMNKNTITYFELSLNSVVIYETFQILWDHAGELGDAVYEFAKDLIYHIGMNPYYLECCYFMSNVEKFYHSSPMFFKYQILKKKFGSINWKSRYQLNITVHGLFVQCNKQKNQIIKDILGYVDTLARVCKQYVLYLYFNHLMLSGLAFSWKKRKMVNVYKYLTMKIGLETDSYHREVMKQFLKKIGLVRRQRNPFKERLREKLKRFKTAK